MKFFRAFIFLFCLPAIFLQPIPSFSMQQETFYNERGTEIFIPRDERGLINPWGYFDAKNIFSHIDGYINHYFDFIELICDEEFLETLSDEELDRILEFTVWVVRYSVPESRPDLKEHYEQEIEELYRLLEEEDDEEEFYFSFNQSQFITFQLAGCIQNPHFTLCKSRKGWFRKKFHHLKHWSSKNRKPLIIGVVVAGTIAAVVITGGVGGSAAAAVGGGLIDSVEGYQPNRVNKPGEVAFQGDYQDNQPPPPQSQYASIPESPALLPPIETPSQGQFFPIHKEEPSPEELYETIARDAEITKELILDADLDNPGIIKQFATDAKDTVSLIIHRTLDEVAAPVNGFFRDPDKLEQFHDNVEAGHELIDRTFNTDFASDYTQETKEYVAIMKNQLGLEVAMGELPIPANAARAIMKGATTTGAIATGVAGSVLTQPNPGEINQSLQVQRQIDPCLPQDPDSLLENPNWNEITHPDARSVGHRTFENYETGEKLGYDEAKPNEPGHRGRSHWHRHNPNGTGSHNKYLDANGNPVAKGSPESHLYSPQ